MELVTAEGPLRIFMHVNLVLQKNSIRGGQSFCSDFGQRTTKLHIIINAYSYTWQSRLHSENMPKQTLSNSVAGARLDQISQQLQSAVVPHKTTTTTAYEAPYYPYERSRVPGMYMVAFHRGHTIERHFAFLGREFEFIALGDIGYGASLDDQLFNAIRCDPGIRFVEDNSKGKRD